MRLLLSPQLTARRATAESHHRKSPYCHRKKKTISNAVLARLNKCHSTRSTLCDSSVPYPDTIWKRLTASSPHPSISPLPMNSVSLSIELPQFTPPSGQLRTRT